MSTFVTTTFVCCSRLDSTHFCTDEKATKNTFVVTLYSTPVMGRQHHSRLTCADTLNVNRRDKLGAVLQKVSSQR